MSFSIRMVAAGLVVMGAMGAAQAQDAQKAAYLDTNLPAEQRAADLVKHMTLEEKAGQLVNQARAIPRLGVPALRLVERIAARRCDERDDGISRANRARCDIRSERDSRDGDGHQHRGARGA